MDVEKFEYKWSPLMDKSEVESFVKDIIYHEVWNMGGEMVVFFSTHSKGVSSYREIHHRGMSFYCA